MVRVRLERSAIGCSGSVTAPTTSRAFTASPSWSVAKNTGCSVFRVVGPIGVAAIFYAFLSLRQTGIEATWTIGSLVICASILAHGFTVYPWLNSTPSSKGNHVF